MKKYSLIFTFFLGLISAFGQSITQQADSLLNLIELTEEDSAQVKYYSELGSLFRHSNSKRSIRYSHKTLQLAKKYEKKEYQRFSYMDLFTAHLVMGSHTDSLLKYVQLLEAFIRKHNAEKDLYTVYFNYGKYYEKIGMNDKTLESYLKSLELVRKYNLSEQVEAGLLNNIGANAKINKQYDVALLYYKEALLLVTQKVWRANILGNTGDIYLLQNKLDSALLFFQQSLEIHNELENSPGIILCHMKYSSVYNELQQYNKSKTNLEKALSILEKSGTNSLRSSLYVAFAKYYFLVKQFNLAIKYSKLANQEQNKIGISETDYNTISYKILHRSYAAKKQYQEAYKSLNYLNELNDSLNDMSMRKKVETLRTEFETEQKEIENQYLKEQQKVAEVTIQKQQYATIGLIVASIFALILSIVSLLLLKTTRSRKLLAQKLLIKNQELHSLNKAKTRFFTNVSHELKTPLTLILNPLQKLKKRKNLSEDDRFLLKTAERKSLELLDLTNQILELTKFEVEKVELYESKINFLHFLRKTYAEFESLAKWKQIDLRLNYQGNEQLSIKTDEYKLKIILRNLLSNALKFTEAGETIKITATEKENTLNIQVYDTGQGIHPHDLHLVFDRYFQTKRPNTIPIGGTGIGLAICKEYTKLLGGDIQVQSEFGNYTAFTVVLPKIITTQPVLASHEPTNNSNKTKHSSSSQTSIPNEKKQLPTILVVEDNLDMQKYLSFTLHNKYNIKIARNGYEGLKILAQQTEAISLIISDVMMPVMDGYEFLEKVKQNPTFAAIPVIMLTALSDTKFKLKGLRIGVDGYLSKPFADEELITRIENLITNYGRKETFNLETRILSPTSNIEGILTTEAIKNVTVEDLDWLKNLEEVVGENITKNDFTADSLAKQLAVSRSLLYRKIKALTGMTPNKYISQVRFEKALFYLETKQFSTVKTVAFEVGFRDEKHFARNFKKIYGKYPSEYL